MGLLRMIVLSLRTLLRDGAELVEENLALRQQLAKGYALDDISRPRVHAVARACHDGTQIDVLPLAHPRQVAKLGKSSPTWFNLHQAWLESAGNLLV
jgi:hypothetical protein